MLISLEALDLYLVNNIGILPIDYVKQKNILKIRSSNYIRNSNSNLKCSFKTSIAFIYHLQYLLSKPHIQQIITNILVHYNNVPTNKFKQQYINRFKYIYNKTLKYYNSHSHYGNFNLEEIAILNLYIIKNVSSPEGIYILIKYLYL